MRIIKKSFFGVLVLLLGAACAHADDAPLNILFILTDDQATDTISAHGNERISTPSIDRLADSGISFTHVFNQGSWSGAVCAPSRRMINTGRHIYRTGMGPKDDKQGADAKDYK
ncbi:MAG: sulfatase-like hydrolase/transferase, partial [Gammaproteobacteria bacterium]|nr:sulfatase-like hydrolase/transferase [Gammaproteobacteria bacterium]